MRQDNLQHELFLWFFWQQLDSSQQVATVTIITHAMTKTLSLNLVTVSFLCASSTLRSHDRLQVLWQIMSMSCQQWVVTDRHELRLSDHKIHSWELTINYSVQFAVHAVLSCRTGSFRDSKLSRLIARSQSLKRE